MADEKTSADNATTNPEQTVEGQSFYNAALTGSGTITEDGTYADPLPDPTQVRGLGPDRTSGGRRVLGGLDPDVPRSVDMQQGRDRGEADDADAKPDTGKASKRAGK